MVCPLVQNVEHRCLGTLADAVLGDNSHAQRGYELMYAVVYLGVDVIRSARKHYDRHMLAACIFDYLLALCFDIVVEAVHSRHTCLICSLDFLFVKVILSERLGYSLHNVLFKVKIKVRIEEILLGKLGDIRL